MQLNVQNSTVADIDFESLDLGPLAWVMDELRKSLDGSAKALKRFVREAEVARGTDLLSIDALQLRIARQQLHQAVGALEMVGLKAPALMLHAMESAVQRFIQSPAQCSLEAAAKIERASFALTEYLEGVLAGRPISSVSLFPQYRDVQTLALSERIHPADLWSNPWRWLQPELNLPVEPAKYADKDRATFDHSVLQIMKGVVPQAGEILKKLSLGLSAEQSDQQPRIFWTIAAAFFEALALSLLPTDIYVRRAASRILVQYTSSKNGRFDISERLAQDLLFFCAQAVPTHPAAAPVLSAVRSTYDLDRNKPVDYELVQFGRFDPALLAQARKRIVSAKETWSYLSAGDVNKSKLVVDQFNLVADSLIKLHPPSEPLAQAILLAIDQVARVGIAPAIELAMEVATAILYLEAAFDDLDPSDPDLVDHTQHLAKRLDRVMKGGLPEPLEPWMEELYRQVSDKQTMGSVVGELRISLGDVEKSLDLFFRDPQDKTVLQNVPGQLSQMRGVLSVLGLQQASQAVLHMRGSVEQMLANEVNEPLPKNTKVVEQLGNNVGALSFLIDMLNYQPVLAKKLFVYDELQGELKPLMGRTHRATSPVISEMTRSAELHPQIVFPDLFSGSGSGVVQVKPLTPDVELAAIPAFKEILTVTTESERVTDVDVTSLKVSSHAPMALTDLVDIEEEDLRSIFLDEAREATLNGQHTLTTLVGNPSDIGQLAILRRVFHTLKGSSRMVGLNEFGHAAWAVEQLFNSWLADQKPASDELILLTKNLLAGFSRWVEDIANSCDGVWNASAFCASADAMRTERRLLYINVPALLEETPTSKEALQELVEAQGEAAPLFDVLALDSEVIATEIETELDFDALFGVEQSPIFAPANEAAPAMTFSEDIRGIDFSSLAALSGQHDALLSTASPHTKTSKSNLDSDEVDAFEGLASNIGPDTTHGVEVAADALSETNSEHQFFYGTEELISDADGLDQLTANVPETAFQDGFESVPTLSLNASGETAALVDEQIKIIGNLRIGIPLYNVYLNEADEWSRRLVTELSEWAIEFHHPVNYSTVALAHSLAGSSATVGFDALSQIARALEQALQQSQVHYVDKDAAAYASLFVDAAEDIRRLLHQFAAGFLKEADTNILKRLRKLEFFEGSSAWPIEDDTTYGSSTTADSGELDPSDPYPFQIPSQSKSVPIPQTVNAAAQFHPIKPAAVGLSFVPFTKTKFEAVVNDEIDAVDAIDRELFPIFDEEAAELLPQLGGALRQWSARPDNQSVRVEVLRILHTLKGSARLAGALRLGEMAHRIESEIEYLGLGALTTQDFELLLSRFDAMMQTVEALRKSEPGTTPHIAPHIGSETEPAAVHLHDEFAPSAAHIAHKEVIPFASVQQVAGKSLIPAPQSIVKQSLRLAATATVRVRSQLLDRMITQAGEIMITRSRLEVELGKLQSSLGDMSGNLNRLREQLRDIELQAESQMQSRLAHSKELKAGFDPLEFDRFTRVQELTRMMAESVNDVATLQRILQRSVQTSEDNLIVQARQSRELQSDLLRTRMVEFESISDRLYRVVRQASKETGKQVRLDLVGGTIEMDRGLLDRMTPAFEHLLRNCVAHGIENPDVREAAGKDPVGLVVVNLRQEGNDVSVEFSDDGAGLNLKHIRERATALGLVPSDQTLPDQDAINLIYLPGFTTAIEVTELFGRGIGMDVVRSEVYAVGGRIETSTVAGKGTHFKLILPLTTAVTHVVMMRAGNLSVGVPVSLVETVRRTPAKELQQAYSTGFLDVAGEAVPFFWAGALLQASPRSLEAQAKTSSIVVVRSAAQRMALHVDEVMGNQEVVIKNLGPQLSRLPGLAGMSVLATGAVLLIYNPLALAAIYGNQVRALSADNAEPHMLEWSGTKGSAQAELVSATRQVPLILVVDDSITVRRVTQRLLQREGYRVVLAADGLQALERLQDERPTVVLTDIEMPRMDGFDLTRNIRSDAHLKDLPIVMITSRIAEKHREHAKELGVDHYLGKPYSEDELMSLVRHYCKIEVAV